MEYQMRDNFFFYKKLATRNKKDTAELLKIRVPAVEKLFFDYHKSSSAL